MTDRRFLVIGVGGVGITLADGLCRMLEYREPGSMLVLVDGDYFELKNHERQAFTEMGNKAEVKANELTPQFPQTIIVPRPMWVVPELKDDEEDSESKIPAKELLQENDVVFCVVDNFACRKLIFDTAREFDNIDIFTGGNDDALFGSTYHYARRDGQDITDHPVTMHPEYENPPDRNPGALSCQERAMLEGGQQLLATNLAVAAFLLGRAHKTIFEEEEDLHSEIYFDLGLGAASGFDRRSDEELQKLQSI